MDVPAAAPFAAPLPAQMPPPPEPTTLPQNPLPPHAYPSSPPSPAAKRRPFGAIALGILGATIVLGVGLFAVVFALNRSSRQPVTEATGVAAKPPPAIEPATSASVAAPSSAAAAAPSGSKVDFKTCSVVKASAIAPSVEGAAPVRAALTASGLVVSFAADRNQAVAYRVDTDSLAASRVFHNVGIRPVFNVVSTGGDRFEVDHDHPRVRGVRTVGTSPPVRIGLNFFGLVRLADPADPEVVWKVGESAKLSPPEVAGASGGHVVVVSRGRWNGDILAGWLDPAGKPTGALTPIDVEAKELGQVRVAAQGRRAAIVAGVQRVSGGPRVVLAAVGAQGAFPAKLRPLETGSDFAMLPQIASDGSGWVVQWFEPTHGPLVRIRRFDAELKPRGPAVTLSSKAKLAPVGGAIVQTKPGVFTGFYAVRTGRSSALWASRIACE